MEVPANIRLLLPIFAVTSRQDSYKLQGPKPSYPKVFFFSMFEALLMGYAALVQWS